ncbi:MAG: cyclic nucleotide-binding domain-containing protein [Ardenticatenales bacterium]|nr:cyclic nucleotide-binding domain-containing protein [Ardenticatenales bacterium]
MQNYQPILQRTGLFRILSEAEIDALARVVSVVSFTAGEIICREGEVGEEMYILVEGAVQVYTITTEGDEVVLDKKQVGQYFGEQALLPDGDGMRTASIRAHTDTRCLIIRQAEFQRVLTRDHPLRNHLVALGQTQLRDKIMHQSVLFRSLRFGQSGNWFQEEVLPEQHTIFRQGDPGDRFYYILSGKVALYHEEADGSQQLLMYLQTGGGFGELALLKRQPRTATAITHSQVRLLTLEGDKFREFYQQSPELRDYLQSLQKIYSLTGRGFITQHAGKFLDMDCITSMYHFTNGKSAMSSQVVGQHIFNMSLLFHEENESSAPERIRYEDPAHRISRELLLFDNRVVGVMAQGLWQELGKIHQMIIDGTLLAPEQLRHFKQQGYIDSGRHEAVYADTDIICECLQLNSGTLTQMIYQGCPTVASLAETTGASTVCGSCRPLLQELVGHESWTPVMVLDEFEVVQGVRSFRFAPYNTSLKRALPGQHVVVQARIDGRWVQRPYTISSPTNETSYREITVKREPLGYFSNWLFDRPHHNTLLRLSDPQGEYIADLTQPQPIVCLVAGIGLTPALAILRSALGEEKIPPIHIDYSVTSHDLIVYRDELERAAQTREEVTVRFRITREEGRLGQKDVAEIVQCYPGARFYICGPATYLTDVEQYLLNNNVPATSIEIEEFKPIGEPALSTATRSLERSWLLLGAGLLLAFVVQESLQLKIAWLENLQSMETYKRWSGVGLLGFMAAQWILPYLRLTGQLRLAARHYHLHKRQGMLAPLVYFFHSTGMGYAYLLVLSSVFFANLVLGLLDPDTVVKPEQRKSYGFYWLLLHVALSVALVALIGYHIFIVFYYT